MQAQASAEHEPVTYTKQSFLSAEYHSLAFILRRDLEMSRSTKAKWFHKTLWRIVALNVYVPWFFADVEELASLSVCAPRRLPFRTFPKLCTLSRRSRETRVRNGS
jgi:hypothetical protein